MKHTSTLTQREKDILMSGHTASNGHNKDRLNGKNGHETQQQQAAKLAASWREEQRWQGIRRPYTPEDVLRLRGSIQIEHTLARLGAERLWGLLHTEPFINALGALTGNQAVQQVRAG